MVIRGVDISVVIGDPSAQGIGDVVAAAFEPTIDAVRKTACEALLRADAAGISAIAFGALGFVDGGLTATHASKVLAQEIFRYVKDVPFGREPAVHRVVVAVADEATKKVYVKNIEGYIAYMSHKGLLGPYLTVDGIVAYQNGIVLIERTNPPLGWALPGGFVDYGETVETAVVREIKEETNLEFTDIDLLCVSSDPKRDARFHTVSVVYVGKGSGELRAGDDACGAKVFPLDALPQGIAFDHRALIERAIATGRIRVS
jgi:ADP-ribose pyrophosphatase YjhB (NUDIX family)